MAFSPKILIVDDEPKMCESLRMLLGVKDYEVYTAASGAEARAILQDRHFDVALVHGDARHGRPSTDGPDQPKGPGYRRDCHNWRHVFGICHRCLEERRL